MWYQNYQWFLSDINQVCDDRCEAVGGSNFAVEADPGSFEGDCTMVEHFLPETHDAATFVTAVANFGYFDQDSTFGYYCATDGLSVQGSHEVAVLPGAQPFHPDRTARVVCPCGTTSNPATVMITGTK